MVLCFAAWREPHYRVVLEISWWVKKRDQRRAFIGRALRKKGKNGSWYGGGIFWGSGNRTISSSKAETVSYRGIKSWPKMRSYSHSHQHNRRRQPREANLVWYSSHLLSAFAHLPAPKLTAWAANTSRNQDLFFNVSAIYSDVHKVLEISSWRLQQLSGSTPSQDVMQRDLARGVAKSRSVSISETSSLLHSNEIETVCLFIVVILRTLLLYCCCHYHNKYSYCIICSMMRNDRKPFSWGVRSSETSMGNKMGIDVSSRCLFDFTSCCYWIQAIIDR